MGGSLRARPGPLRVCAKNLHRAPCWAAVVFPGKALPVPSHDRLRRMKLKNGSPMGYNKKQHLQDNILAIQAAFSLKDEKRGASRQERAVLERFSGFGGLKCILRPCDRPEDKAGWPVSEQFLFEDTRLLYNVIGQHCGTQEEYTAYSESLRGSVLSAYSLRTGKFREPPSSATCSASRGKNAERSPASSKPRPKDGPCRSPGACSLQRMLQEMSQPLSAGSVWIPAHTKAS